MSGTSDPDDSLVGRVLDGRYEVQQIIGVGGMGAVYRAIHQHLGSAVAIKVMRSEHPNAAERFLAEARRTFRLDHPNCVRVTDAGVAEGYLYLVMELLEGRTLGEELDNERAISAQRVAHIGAQTAGALGCAHDLGYVHRDIKPDNIMLLHRGGDPDFVKVLDFGLAKLTDEAKLRGKRSVMSFTRNGMVFGTPIYMSPEQAQGHRLDARSDIYSLGVVLFEALAGGPPFDSDSDVEVLIAHVKEKPPRLRDYCDVPRDLEQTILQMLAKRPEDRPTSANEAAAALSGVAPLPRRASGVSRAVASSETMTLDDQASIAILRNTSPTTALGRPSDGESRSRGRIGWLVFAALILAGAAVAAVVLTDSQNTGATGAVDAALTTTAEFDASARLPADAQVSSSAAVDAATAIDKSVPPPTIPPTIPPTMSAAERKAVSLYRQARDAMRAGKGELSYLPKLQAAYKLDRRNKQVRRTLVKVLLDSRGHAQKALGCKMIRRDKRRYEQSGCKALE